MDILHTVLQTPKILPATFIIVFCGLLWLIGIACSEGRRSYVLDVSKQGMEAVGKLMQGPQAVNPPPRSSDDAPTA